MFASLAARGTTLDAEPAFGPSGGLFENPGRTVVDTGGSFRVVRGVEVFARVLNLFDKAYEEVLGFPAPAAPRLRVSALLQADNVSFAYGHSRATQATAGARAPAAMVVDRVSLTIPRGGLVGILGPNGSGKTTLLRLLSGTRRPFSGRVLLDDRPLDRYSRRDIARRIAVVPQETELAFEYSVLEMVLMGRHPHLGLFELEGPADFAIAREMLHATGTAELEHRPFSTLSGGEKQRVVIAGALTQAADILLLDEPTASLDLGVSARGRVALARAQSRARRHDGDLDARSQHGRQHLSRARAAQRRQGAGARSDRRRC